MEVQVLAAAPTTSLTAAADLESAAVATLPRHARPSCRASNGAALVASIQIAEARHCTVLRDLAGVTDVGELLVDTEADSLLGNG